MKVELRITGGEKIGKVFTFEEPQGFIFGRADDCTCVVSKEDRTLSRHHFIMEINPPNVWIKDLGSLNGVYINGKKYGGRPEGVAPSEASCSEPIPLCNGDRIKVGNNELLFNVQAPVKCVECNQDIDPENLKEAVFIAGTYLCLKCRKKARQKIDAEKEDKAKPEKDMLDFKKGIKLSMNQREKAEIDPAGVIDILINRFINQHLKGKVPDIEGYRIKKRIGQGGFGAVYVARRIKDEKKVALKVMLQTRKPNKKQFLMFLREKAIAEQIKHPQIVHCERTSIAGDVYFLEMEYMNGGSLWDLLKQKRKLSIDEASSIMIQVLEGLEYAHTAELVLELEGGNKEIKGVIHRDLKPPNILLSGKPGEWIAKISDFGLAKAFSEAGMTKGSITVGVGYCCGSPHYMAPEHLINYRFLKPPTDVFEIAATFYHMLTGKTVWKTTPGVDVYKVILEGTITPVRKVDRNIPNKVAKIIDRALSRKPDDRYNDAGEMLKALKNAV
jgi:hypothetical protein